MAYTKQTWLDAPSTATPLSAARLNYMEDGIAGAHAIAEAHPLQPDPHTQYQKESEKDQADGYAALTAGRLVAPARLGTGALSATVVLHGDGVWRSLGTSTHPDLASHDSLGLATQAELNAHAATTGHTHPDLAAHDTLGLATEADLTNAIAGRASSTDPRFTTVPHVFVTAAYALVASDPGKLIDVDAAAGVALSIPTFANVGIPVGSVIGWRQYGAGQITFTPLTGVTLRTEGGRNKSAGQNAEGTLTKRATNEWVLSGSVTT